LGQTGRINEFEVCCIPFFVRDLDLGDRVLTESQDGKPYVVTRVSAKSGHYTFRAWLAEAGAELRAKILDQLHAHGCLVEWYSQDLLGVDAESELLAREVGAFLARGQELGLLSFETGRIG
jgi:hypothetical protein